LGLAPIEAPSGIVGPQLIFPVPGPGFPLGFPHAPATLSLHLPRTAVLYETRLNVLLWVHARYINSVALTEFVLARITLT
jgi:hypothetical protein